jgi:hypothetical protein
MVKSGYGLLFKLPSKDCLEGPKKLRKTSGSQSLDQGSITFYWSFKEFILSMQIGSG